MIVEKDEFVRAKISGGATIGQLRRAIQDLPDDAIMNDMEIVEFAYDRVEPFPLKFEMRVEWVKQPEDDTLPTGGAVS